MSSLINTFLKQVFRGDQIKDWDHASRLFVANSYELAPKSSYLFHVFFDLNNAFGGGAQGVSPTRQMELGMLVKQVSLPKFDIQTKTLNAYNRANVHQTKINYSPVSITFHDDAMNVVKNFWYDYYNYYYRDSDNSESLVYGTHNEISGPRTNSNWGYTPRGALAGDAEFQPYLRSIRIYSLFNKRFSEYVLLNPIIKSFQHGEHNSAGSTDTMTHSMTVEYESVAYSSGYVKMGAVKGWGALHYDNRPSPLTPAGGGASNILGQGGILQTGAEIFSDIQKGDFGSAIFKGGRFAGSNQGANLKAMAINESLKLGKDIIAGAANPLTRFVVPSIGSMYNTNTVVSGIQAYTGETSDNIYEGMKTLVKPGESLNLDSLGTTLQNTQAQVSSAVSSAASAVSDTVSSGVRTLKSTFTSSDSTE